MTLNTSIKNVDRLFKVVLIIFTIPPKNKGLQNVTLYFVYKIRLIIDIFYCSLSYNINQSLM